VINNARFVVAIVLVGVCFIACTSLVGCGGGDTSSRYEPAKQTARTAIDTALKTWKSGVKLGPIAGKPEINMFDERWQAGKKLEEYEVLDEVSGSDHPQFKVRVKIAGSAEEVNEFLAVGIDPMLVFRDKDYRKATGSN
jgi:hypothetical protein